MGIPITQESRQFMKNLLSDAKRAVEYYEVEQARLIADLEASTVNRIAALDREADLQRIVNVINSPDAP